MLHDLITSFLVAFAAITPSEFLTKIWEVPLDEMDEGDVRYTAASVKVSDAADPKASHSRSCDSTDRLHHGSLVAPHTAKPRRWGKCDAGRCVAIATGLAENTCPPMSAFHPMPTVNSRLEICREVPRTDIADTE